VVVVVVVVVVLIVVGGCVCCVCVCCGRRSGWHETIRRENGVAWGDELLAGVVWRGVVQKVR